jgi:drug/metabolite transporter (DMT)-like permease
MSLAIALPCGALAAVVYGGSTAVQHSAVNTGRGEVNARGLIGLLRNPRWLLSVGGDGVGLVLQVIALSTGPVLIIQPLLVLAVPVSLPIGWALGGPRPRAADYVACAAIIGGLATFFAIVGDPGPSEIPPTRSITILIIVALAAGVLACLAARGAPRGWRAVVFGAIAGAWFGIVGVLINTASDVWQQSGWHGFAEPNGWLLLLGVLLLGGAGTILTQISFQVGALGASFPANESAAPLVAVILGTALLHEDLPVNPLTILAYAGCFAAVVAGTIRLANPPIPKDQPPTDRP